MTPDQSTVAARGLSANRDFLLLWGGQSAARLGAEVTRLAIPLVAVVTLGGTPTQVAAVTAIGYLPTLLLGLVAGVWIDRTDRRRLLVIADFGRCASLGVIPALAWLDVLNFPMLYLSVFVTGVLTMAYDLAYQSMLPQVVAPEHLVEANGRLEATRSVAMGVGSLVVGGLVHIMMAPYALLVNALGYVASGTCAVMMRPVPSAERGPDRRFRSELAEGVRAVLRDPLQLRLALTAVSSNFFAVAIQALYVLYASRELGLGPVAIGITFAAGAAGAIGAAALLSRINARTGPRAAILGGLGTSGCGYLLISVAAEVSGPAVVVVLAVSSLLGQGGIVIVAARAMAWRQQITPSRLLGRVISVSRTVAFGVLPVSAVLAGVLAETIGLRATLAVAAIGMLAGGLWLAVPFRPVATLPEQ